MHTGTGMNGIGIQASYLTSFIYALNEPHGCIPTSGFGSRTDPVSKVCSRQPVIARSTPRRSFDGSFTTIRLSSTRNREMAVAAEAGGPVRAATGAGLGSGGARGAYVDPDLVVPGAASGPLSGLTFAIKDLFDVRRSFPACPCLKMRYPQQYV